jgi:hypothetical protein
VQLAAREQGEIYHAPSPLTRLMRHLRYPFERLLRKPPDGLKWGWIYGYDATAQQT